MQNRIKWGEKRYYSLNDYLKTKFGEKVYKLSLNGGMSCPNRDGTLGTGGCIFCSEGGSGDFASSSMLSITKQIEDAKLRIKSKTDCRKFIAYFQAFTNTYASPDYLRKVFYEAINHPDIVALSIATRPDCLQEEIIDLLFELNEIKPVWVELGLQTIHPKTADFIRRGYNLDCFTEAVERLNKIHIATIVHLIIGLPYLDSHKITMESKDDILESIAFLAKLPLEGIKLQLLHVLKDTDLAAYLSQITILSKEEYIDYIITCIEHLPEDMVIHRITGDGPKSLLLAPDWSKNKKDILNRINHEMKVRNTWQGKYYN